MSDMIPLISDEDIERFMRVCVSEKDDSQRCRQIIGQLRGELDKTLRVTRRLRKALVGIIGEENPISLKDIKAAVRFQPGADEETKQASIEAIDAILETEQYK